MFLISMIFKRDRKKQIRFLVNCRRFFLHIICLHSRLKLIAIYGILLNGMKIFWGFGNALNFTSFSIYFLSENMF